MRRTDILERKEDILKWIEEDLPNAEIAIEDFAKSVTAAEFTYRGHSYIWFHHPGGWDGNDGIIQTAIVIRNSPPPRVSKGEKIA